MIQLHHVSLDPNETNTEIHSMATIGYIRVSTVEQNTDRQLDGLQFDKTFTDHCSGGSTQRPALESMLEFVREGDTVNVHSIDRLAHSPLDFYRLVTIFELFRNYLVTVICVLPKFTRTLLAIDGQALKQITTSPS